MMNVDKQEIDKFAKLANFWWDPKGPLKTLHAINPARLHYIQSHVNLKGKKVLDVGCGGGILSEALAEAGAQVTAIDLAEPSIEVAAKHAREKSLEIDYQCTALEDLTQNQFEVITCLELLEHVPDPKAIIEQCAKRLCPGGTLILSTINRTLKAYLKAIVAAEYVLQLLPKQTHDYDKFIKPSEISAWLRESEFEVIDISGLDYNPLTQTSEITDDVAVNYLLTAQLEPTA